MNYEFCLNPISLPAADADSAINFLNDIFIGIASLYNENTAITLYSDKKLDDTILAPEFTYYDYKISLAVHADHDLSEFILTIDDRSPFLNFILESEMNDIIKYEISLFNFPLAYSEEHDILKFACLEDVILISLPTDNIWKREAIPVKIKAIESGIEEENTILNVYNHIIDHLQVKYDWKKEFPDIIFSAEFEKWLFDLDEKNQVHVTNLIRRAYTLHFHGTIEQTKSIKGSNDKIWEWRGGCPHFGKGRIRILYASMTEKICVLNGFIKHDNDYTAEIYSAETIFKELRRTI